MKIERKRNQNSVTKGNNRKVTPRGKRAEFRDTVVATGKETNPPVKAKRVSNGVGNANKNLPVPNGGSLKGILNKYLNVQTGKYRALIKLVSSPSMLIMAYELIKSKAGNTTVGTTDETLDGITKEWIENLSNEVSEGKFYFKPSRRVLIPKKDGSTRPLGVANPREKVLQKAMTMVLEAIYEPVFSDSSHGFRPKRSCHSALHQLYLKVKSGYSWVIEGDISKCYDKIPHIVILNCLQEKIECEKFLTLIKRFLQAGYLDPKVKQVIKETVGTPQGAVVSPILCNIVLDKLDKKLEEIKEQYAKGKSRKVTPEYRKIQRIKYENRTGQQKRMKAVDVMDPNFRRLVYVRYADDFVVAILGPKTEASDLKNIIGKFLKENLGLTLNEEKTKITSLQEGFRFLGTELFIRKYNNEKEQPRTSYKRNGKVITAKVHPRIVMHAPIKELLDKLKEKQFIKAVNKEYYPLGLDRLLNFDHEDILKYYSSIIRGIVNYYSFVDNRMRLSSIVRYLRYSCAATLKRKYKLATIRQCFFNFGPELKSPRSETMLYVPTSIELRKKPDSDKSKFNISENVKLPDAVINQMWINKVTKSTVFKSCAICDATENIEMHHLRSVKDVRNKIKQGKASFAIWKGAFLRKQIPLCSRHHKAWHSHLLTKEELATLSQYPINKVT
jgi:group II intron reverse transcriptase/maturase